MFTSVIARLPKGCRLLSACLMVASVLMCATGTALADDDDIVNAAGFESPSFTTTFLGTGQLEGQVNPPGEGQILSPGQWLRAGGGTSTALVQSTVFAPGGGTQAVRVDRAANNDVRWGVPVDHLGYPDYPTPTPPEPVQPLITITWDMRVEQTTGAAGTFGPFFGVEANDAAAAGAVGLLGTLGVDATTGDVLYQASGTGFLTESGAVVTFGAWNRFHLLLDFSTDQYSIFLNSVPLGTFGFVDPGLDNFSDADISAFAAAGDPGSLALTGTGYFDNFLVREGNLVPEPGVAALVVVLVPALLRRYRKRGRTRAGAETRHNATRV